MLKSGKIILLASLLGATLLAGCSKDADKAKTSMQTGAAAPDASAVIATVNGTPITRAVFDAYAVQRTAAAPEGNLDPKSALDDLINREIVYQDGMAQGLDKKAETQANIENQKHNIIASVAVSQHLKDNEPTDAAMKKEYQTQIAKMSPKEFKARHILVKSEQEAKNIIAQLDKGGDFSTIATEKSVDTSSAKNGGDLGWFNAGQMVKPFSDAVAGMAKGKHSTVPVKSDFGWHVILLDDTRDAAPPPAYDKVKDTMHTMVMNDELKVYLEKLKNNAKIEIKDPNFLAAPDAVDANGLPAAPVAAAPAVVPAPAPK